MNKKIYLIMIPLLIVITVLMFLKISSKENIFVGNWVADGTQIQNITAVDKNGNPIYTDKNISPYYLKLKNKKKCILKLTDETLEGTYQINQNKEIYLTFSDHPITLCKIINRKVLECNFFASRFTKNKGVTR